MEPGRAPCGLGGRPASTSTTVVVLASLPPELQTFALETAILAELTPELCQAITRRDDAARLLEDLYRRNLVVSVAADHRPPTTDHRPPDRRTKSWQLKTQTPRGHPKLKTSRNHGQCTATIRCLAHSCASGSSATTPIGWPSLHRRAAEAQPGTEQAIGHYLAAQLWQPAAFSIILSSEGLLQRGQLGTLRRWIAALPEALRRVDLPRCCAWMALR